jgi:hypothetical protein
MSEKQPVVKESLTTEQVVAWLREQAEARMVNTFSTLDQQEAESLDDAAKYATAANLIEQGAINNLRSRIYGLMDGFSSSSGPALEVELATVKAERDALSGQLMELKAKSVHFLMGKDEDGPITIERRSQPHIDLWAICCHPHVRSRDGLWEREPMPSSRSDEFLARNRYTFDEAWKIADELITEAAKEGK